MANETERVGIIGVGRMGFAMAKHLINHGYRLTACDINQESVEKARQMGAAVAKTPAELGRTATFVILGVGYDEEVNEVVLGPTGVLQSLKAGAIIAVSSTAAPEACARSTRRHGPKASTCSMPRSAAAAGTPTPASCWRCLAGDPRWSSAAGRSTPPFPPTSPTWARSATARSARR
jgi:3-hydroxyisobutyrate dehydrogenase